MNVVAGAVMLYCRFVIRPVHRTSVRIAALLAFPAYLAGLTAAVIAEGPMIGNTTSTP